MHKEDLYIHVWETSEWGGRHVVRRLEQWGVGLKEYSENKNPLQITYHPNKMCQYTRDEEKTLIGKLTEL